MVVYEENPDLYPAESLNYEEPTAESLEDSFEEELEDSSDLAELTSHTADSTEVDIVEEDVVEEVEEPSTLAAFAEPELVLPSEEEIFGGEEMRIPFSNKSRSREVRELEEELANKLAVLDEKIALLEKQIENTK